MNRRDFIASLLAAAASRSLPLPSGKHPVTINGIEPRWVTGNEMSFIPQPTWYMSSVDDPNNWVPVSITQDQLTELHTLIGQAYAKLRNKALPECPAIHLLKRSSFAQDRVPEETTNESG